MPHDLLAGLLPTGNPLAPYVPGHAVPPALPEAADSPAFAPTPLETPILVVPPKSVRRRRRSLVGPIMVLLVLGMFAGLATCVWLLATGKGLTTDGKIIAAQDQSTKKDRDNPNPPPANNPDGPAIPIAPAENRPQVDIGAGQPPSSPPDQPEPPMEMETPSLETTSEPALEPEPETPTAEMTPPESPTVEMPTSETSAPETPAPDMNSEPSAEAERVAAETLESIANQLRSGSWENLDNIIESAQPLMTSDVQRQKLQTYDAIMQLAEYYQEGIGRGAESIGSTETFELVPGLTAAVVESSREKIAIKIEGRVKSYPLAEAPLVILHRLATFALPADDPEAVAGRAVFQCLWSQSTTAHRKQALDWIRAIRPTETINPATLETTLSELFDLSVAADSME